MSKHAWYSMQLCQNVNVVIFFSQQLSFFKKYWLLLRISISILIFFYYFFYFFSNAVCAWIIRGFTPKSLLPSSPCSSPPVLCLHSMAVHSTVLAKASAPHCSLSPGRRCYLRIPVSRGLVFKHKLFWRVRWYLRCQMYAAVIDADTECSAVTRFSIVTQLMPSFLRCD